MQQAERGLVLRVIETLTAVVTDRRVVVALTAVILSTLGWLVSKAGDIQPHETGIANDPCYVTGNKVNNQNQQACIAIQCALLAQLGLSCHPAPTPVPPTPVSTGGSTSVSTGGTSSTGGRAATGGSAATGGTSAPSTGCPIVAFPDTPAPLSAAKLAKHHHVGKRHHRHPGRAAPTLVAAGVTTCSSAQPVCDPPINQGDRGSCTGNAADAALCSLGDSADYSESVADAIYEQGTCIDNGCSIPCSCNSCKAAYCPSTDANDVGSNGSSVVQYLVDIGKLKSYTTADTTAQLLTCLATPGRAAVIEVDWYNSQFTTNSDGKIVVTTSSGLAGGHELFAWAYDAARNGVWVHNSWGLWGQCYRSQETSATPTDGTGCGYGWIAVSDLTKLNFDADCLSL